MRLAVIRREGQNSAQILDVRFSDRAVEEENPRRASGCAARGASGSGDFVRNGTIVQLVSAIGRSRA
jgi:hypothetical protein